MTEVVLYTDDVPAARVEITAAGGRVRHVLTPSVLVAELPAGAALHASTTERPSSLDPMSRRAVDAWTAARSRSATEGLPWDTPGFVPPG